MANNFFRRAAFLIVLGIVLVAQNALRPNCLFAQESNHKLSQKLEWKTEDAAYEYKVEIKDASGKITEYTTEKTQIKVSLPSGNYQWRVTAYDFLGRAASTTEWKKITIKKAVSPVVKSNSAKLIVGKDKKISVPIETEQLDPNAKVELVDVSSNKTIAGKISNGMAIFEKVPEGDFIVKVTNPGGLFSETNPINVRKQTAEEIKLAEEKERQEEKARLEEERRIAEEKRLEEERKIEEERRIAEEKRLEEKRRIEEERRIAEEKQLEEKRRIEEEHRQEELYLAEQERLEKERIAEEKRLKREAWENRERGTFYFMLGPQYLLGLDNTDIFLDQSTIIGLNAKFEMLPLKIGKSRFGVNLQAALFPIFPIETSYSQKSALFVPATFNLSMFFPLAVNKVELGFQGGIGAIGYLYSEKYKTMEDGSSRENISNLYINYMLDAGLTFRFIPQKKMAIDVNAQFANCRIGGYNVVNVSAGIMMGWRL